MKTALRLTVAPIVLVSLKVAAGDAIVFDVRKDFSTSENPAGVWSYGWFQTLTSTFQLHTNKGYYPEAPQLFMWWTSFPRGGPGTACGFYRVVSR